ncbi:MAG: hypothetical protein A2W22_03275 [Candidatus Levybacteria bacterium RBG_16_35_11]|nr:MAG: hypothetical protein A2W22_03275 [Candidatus Levybacteria bacterium RBG_16_35_11]
MEQPLPHELRERITTNNIELVEANTYKPRRKVNVIADGQARVVHSLKGGFEDGVEKKTTGAVYEVFFDPETNEWLKITTPKSHGSESKALDRDADIMAASLILAGFPDLAEKVKKCNVVIEGKSTNGFWSPHIGPSLEAMIRVYRSAKKTMDLERYIQFEKEAKKFFSEAYTSALDHAIQLYLKHGCWTQDANPGNILFRANEVTGELKPVLIDFVGKHQYRQEGVFEYLTQLRTLFLNHANRHGITFDLGLEPYRELCATERPGRPLSQRRILQAAP